MDKALYRNGYIFIIIRRVLNNFSVCTQSWELQLTKLCVSKYFIHLSYTNIYIYICFSPHRQLYPGSNPWHSVGVGRARRAQKTPVYWMELGLPFMTPRVSGNCSEPLPCHRKYSTSDKQSLCIWNSLQRVFSGFIEPAASLPCSPLHSTVSSSTCTPSLFTTRL